MINVYIEYGSATDHVATLQDEWVYMALLPSLEKLAEDNRGTLSESVFEDTPPPEPITKVHILMCAVKHDFHDDGTIVKVFDTESKALEHMEELEIYDKVNDCEMYEYWVKAYNIEQDGTIQH